MSNAIRVTIYKVLGHKEFLKIPKTNCTLSLCSSTGMVVNYNNRIQYTYELLL